MHLMVNHGQEAIGAVSLVILLCKHSATARTIGADIREVHLADLIESVRILVSSTDMTVAQGIWKARLWVSYGLHTLGLPMHRAGSVSA